ncbi:VapC toxin family PIN domain ribonuclease [Pararhizobium sp. YC-54]|uniref:type II toxin-antitoxin system VapC family toxin n=1 Tax=Pararhizobium sp. YC-54 TaxID=2986920 RepID=UPI0021F6C0E3|nr:PIN domain-containing protein [Pararhizobium sp. YC-54]MCV9998104.1 VapC toxin family PIN domain ribonuclease [Pararhizobium sp. YC-54]
MVLIDTSIWIDHLRLNEPEVTDLLLQRRLLMHPYIIGEIALGTLRNRSAILGMLAELPTSRLASPAEVLRLVDQNKLFGLGIGYVDAHILASLRLTARSQLWTRDKRLHAAAMKLGLARPSAMH